MDYRADAHKMLTKFALLNTETKDQLLSGKKFATDFTTRIVQGFIDCNNKYSDLLIMSAGLHHTLSSTNKSLVDIQELLTALNDPIKELILENDDSSEELMIFFNAFSLALTSVHEGVGNLIKINEISMDGYFHDGDKDQPYADDARTALAAYIEAYGKADPLEDDSDIDETALINSLAEWTKNFKAQEG